MVLKTITNPKYPKIFCTDYVGNVSIKLSTSGTTLSCAYHSVCDWASVSPETKNIYNLLNSKIKLSSK